MIKRNNIYIRYAKITLWKYGNNSKLIFKAPNNPYFVLKHSRYFQTKILNFAKTN